MISDIAPVTSLRSDGENISAYESFNVRWSTVTTSEIDTADMYGLGKVDLVSVLCAILPNDYR